MSSQSPFGGLAPRRLGAMHIVFFTVAASAPLTVLGGGVTTTFAVSGSLGAPLSFVVLAIVLAIFAVGYSAMSRYVANAGAFYAYLAQGLGRAFGVSASFVALLAYNAIQIGLYGLFGYAVGGFINEKAGLTWHWSVYAFIAMGIIGLLGVLKVDLNATVLAVFLIAECIIIAIFDVLALGSPAAGSLSLDGLNPSQLFNGTIGAVMALGIAAFAGFESGAIFSEEAKDPKRTIARATYIAVAFTGIFYAFSSYALLQAVGPTGDTGIAATSAAAGPGALFGTLGALSNGFMADAAVVLFATSVFAAMLSFHNGVARYFFALGRERVLPGVLGRTGVRTGAPFVGSLLQTIIAAVVVTIAVVSGTDPLLELFTWLSGVSAVGLVALLTGTSIAVIGFFLRRQTEENLWQRIIAPALAAILLASVLFLIVTNFEYLGVSPESKLMWILPGFTLVAAVLGLIWGLALKQVRSDVYNGIGQSATDRLEVLPESTYATL
ncbi:amino acid transporter [Allocatelliglobosispora scoriae]|uniref:Amino acid transporter n=1 Tax=Allocatelliglobosispora scoriae TaxID=643052 RepID=A0A841BZT3_9ACTN|nr:APC family permease [Allocatelliglobosispora scoriae]MBB5873008.1 amino acid transporter [Allocatelliglobosispora scoriae]